MSMLAAVGLLGAVLGRWPLAAWARRSLTAPGGGPRMRSRTLHGLCAVSAALGFALLGWRFWPSWLLPALLTFCAVAVVLAAVDLIEHRLPTAVIAVGITAVLVLLVVAAAAGGQWPRLLWALGGACAMFAAYLILALASPRSIGMGDVKLAFLIGLLLGWFGVSAWLYGLIAAFVLGGLVALVAVLGRRLTLRDSLPFGPSMMTAALMVVLVAGP